MRELERLAARMYERSFLPLTALQMGTVHAAGSAVRASLRDRRSARGVRGA